MLTRKDLIWVLDYVECDGIFIYKTEHRRVLNRGSYQSILINGMFHYASLQARSRISGKKLTVNNYFDCNVFVYWDKAGAKWLASPRPNGRFKKLGRFFVDSDVAAVIRKEYERTRGRHINHGGDL